MFAGLVLLSVPLAPPADAPPGIPADPWATRAGPTVSLLLGDDLRMIPPHAPLTVGVRVDPYVPDNVSVRLFRDERQPGRRPAPEAAPEDFLTRIAGVEVQPRAVRPGASVPGLEPPPSGRLPGFALVTLEPPEAGWPPGRAWISVSLVDSVGGEPVRRPLFVGEQTITTEALRAAGLLVPPLPERTPPPTAALTVSELEGGGESSALDPAAPLTAPAGHRLEVRGSYRATPRANGLAYGAGLTVTRTGPGPQTFASARAVADVGPPGEEPDADGTVRYRFRCVLPPPSAPGRYVVSIDPSAGPDRNGDPPRFAPRTVNYEKAAVAPEGVGPGDAE